MWKNMFAKFGALSKVRRVFLGSLICGSSAVYIGPKLYNYGPQSLQAKEEKRVRKF
jgi:hypothetical protein